MRANLAFLFDDLKAGRQNDLTPADQSNYKIVSVRLRSSEYWAFAQQVEALGLTHNMALRIAARRIGGFLEISPEMRCKLEQISSDIGEIARSISKLHTLTTRTNQFNVAEFARQRQAFGEEFAALDGLLQQILNVSRRRQDGKQMLIEAG